MLLKDLKIIKLCLCFFYVVSLSEAAHLSPCRVILQDPRIRDKEILDELIFLDGDQFVFQNMKNKGDHGQVFSQNKEEILALLEKQDTRVTPAGDQDNQKNIYIIQGGQSRLGRIAQKIWTLYGIRMMIDFKYLKYAAGAYNQSEKSIVIGLEDILYPNQLSETLWHEAIHAKNDFESLVHLVINDGMGEDTPYPSFYLDELIAYEKDFSYNKNSKLAAQYAKLQNKITYPRSINFSETLKDLSQRVLSKKTELLDLISHLKALEKNPKLQYQKITSFSFQLNKYREIKVVPSSFLKDPKGSVPRRFLDLFPDLKNRTFMGTHKEYRKDFIRRTHYSINLISKALEIAEKRAIEPLQLEN